MLENKKDSCSGKITVQNFFQHRKIDLWKHFKTEAMDIDALLNSNKGPSKSDLELEDFLEKVNNAEKIISGLKDGTIDPDQLKVRFVTLIISLLIATA